MKKALLIILIITAIPVYIWDAWLLFGNAKNKNATARVQTKSGNHDLTLMVAGKVHFKESPRSPFLPYKEKPKPPAPKPTKALKRARPAKKVEPPKIIITGVMWNPSRPVAMVNLPGGGSAIAAEGAELAGGIKVLAVEKNRIRVASEGQTFWIEK
jgi:hypothetical protein